AVSTPMSNVVFDCKVMLENQNTWGKLSRNKALGLSLFEITEIVTAHPSSRFFYVKKGLPPDQAKTIADLKIPGVVIENKPETFYPLGATTAQLVGFTDVNNAGQDGIELLYDKVLQATPGVALVTTNALGQTLSVEKIITPPHPGNDIYLSIDSRIQYAAYQALKNEVENTHAENGSVVVLDPKTGEVLAAVSYPSFNPNNWDDRTGAKVKAGSITDSFEPGSTAKIVTMSVALDSGKYTLQSTVDTTPGYYFVKGHRIHDDGAPGVLTLTGIIAKSSNVGASKIALSLPHQDVYNRFLAFGVGSSPGSSFPGQTFGVIHPFQRIGDFEYATMSFGYAFSTSLLQLARAYAAVADDGQLRPTSLIKIDTPEPATRIMKSQTAHDIIQMMRAVVVGEDGTASLKNIPTGLLANIPGYDVAGKTGTAHIAGPHGFYKDRFNAMFVGVSPAGDPRVVIAVRINHPIGHFNSFGGISAAPVFAIIATACMRELQIPPTQQTIDDNLFTNQQKFAKAIVDA
ncbi:MAG: penicillin-binding protein 2, partial [Gammaproteobacteria bacterium]|nr:penicillin-binding protein 2 [Gammaproteobacteria bacterium]